MINEDVYSGDQLINSLWPSDDIWRHKFWSTLVLVMACCLMALLHQPNMIHHLISSINSLWPSDAIWQQRFGSTLAQVMACCLMAPSHYLNQYWLIISKVQWHSLQGNFTRENAIAQISLKITYKKFHQNLPGVNQLRNAQYRYSNISNLLKTCNFVIISTYPRGQWVNRTLRRTISDHLPLKSNMKKRAYSNIHMTSSV